MLCITCILIFGLGKLIIILLHILAFKLITKIIHPFSHIHVMKHVYRKDYSCIPFFWSYTLKQPPLTLLYILSDFFMFNNYISLFCPTLPTHSNIWMLFPNGVLNSLAYTHQWALKNTWSLCFLAGSILEKLLVDIFPGLWTSSPA